MIREWCLPGLLGTGPVHDSLMAVRDGFVNFYVVRAPAGLVCIDAGWWPARVKRGFALLGLDVREVAAVLLTHLHWDHASGRGLYPGAEVFAGELPGARSSQPWTEVRDGQTLTAAGLKVQVVATPGHTFGSVSYLVENRFLFTGDALRLRRGEVRPFPACFNRDGDAVLASLRKLAVLDGVEWVLTAHSGATGDAAGAFGRWRLPAPEGRRA